MRHSPLTFVLISLAQQSTIFGAEVASPLVASVAISMLLTPLLFIVLERRVLPLVTDAAEERPQDDIPAADAPVIIAGHGRFGQIVGRILRASGFPTTVLDLDPEIVDILGRLGVKVYYGDASRLELLEAAGCARARLFVVAVDEQEVANAITETVRKHFPDLPIIARARDRVHYFELRRAALNADERLFAARKVEEEILGDVQGEFETLVAALAERSRRASNLQKAYVRRRVQNAGALRQRVVLKGLPNNGEPG